MKPSRFPVTNRGQTIRSLAPVVLVLLSFACATNSALAEPRAFVHPGCLSTREDLARMRAKVESGEQPWKGSWDILVGNTDRWLDHHPEAVSKIYVDSGNGGNNYLRLARDAHRCYQLALRFHGSGDRRFADKAIEIFNAWATTHGPPDGPEPDDHAEGWDGNTNVALRQGLYGYQFACAAELLRDDPGWSRPDFKAFQEYMLDEFYTGNTQFLKTRFGTAPTHYWANWVQSNQAALLSIGVLCDDRQIFDEGLNYFHHGPGNANIAKAVHLIHPNGLGQWQESGRDQGHSLMGPQLLGAICEVAWNQGVDLYGAQSNRFLAGVEYISKYNTGHEVPFITYVYTHSHPGKEKYWVQAELGAGGRGQRRPGWDLVLNHYVNRMGVSAPWTARNAATTRPEGGGFNHGGNSGGFDGLGFTTLTHTRDPIATDARPSALRPYVEGRQITLSWTGAAQALSYNVKRSASRRGPFERLATVDAMCQFHVDTGRTPGQTYYYAVSANTVDGEGVDSEPVAATANWRLRGEVIGAEGSYRNSGADKYTAFDGGLDNYYDAPFESAYVGLDFGERAQAIITSVHYAPRRNFASRMVGGKFEGSNSPDFKGEVVALHTITEEPPFGEWTSRSVQSSVPVRYVRYIAPAGVWPTLAEAEFHGTIRGTQAPSAPSAPTVANENGAILISWEPGAGADSYTVKRADATDASFIVIGNTEAIRLRDPAETTGDYRYTVRALNQAGKSEDSPPGRAP